MKEQKMRVYWIPLIGINAIHINVHSVIEAKKIMSVLAAYDCYLYNKNVRGDYCNTGGVEIFNEETGEWEAWIHDDADGWWDDIDEYIDECKDFKAEREQLQHDNDELFAQVHFN